MTKQVRVAFAGVGNCTSSLIQGLIYYRELEDTELVPGLMHPVLGDYRIRDIVPVAAFDIDPRKVGKDLGEAIFAPPNDTYKISDVLPFDVEVMMGPVMDGRPSHLQLAKRGESKSVTKEAAVHSMVPYEFPMSSGFAFLETQEDTKTAIIWLEGEKFEGAPIHLLAKLDVEDSPNSAGVIIDAIRCCKIARDRGVIGVLESASAYLMKHPPRQFPDEEARQMLEEFITGDRER